MLSAVKIRGLLFFICVCRVATVREKVLENEKFSRSGKSQGITFSVREILKKWKKSWKSQGISKFS